MRAWEGNFRIGKGIVSSIGNWPKLHKCSDTPPAIDEFL